MGFWIPSLEQYRYIRRYKRQRRLEREQREAAAAVATLQNSIDHTAITGNENDALPCTLNPPCNESHKQTPSFSSHTKRHDRKRRRTHNKDDKDDFSVGSDSVAASHISDLLGESQSDVMDDNRNAVEAVAKKNSDHGLEDKDVQQCDIQSTDNVAVGQQETETLETAKQHDSDLDVSQPRHENTQSSSATELPPVNERIKLSCKRRVHSEYPSKLAATAAAAAANYLATKTQEPASQEMKAPPPPVATTSLERHTSRTTSYADSGLTLSVPEQEPARAPSRQTSSNYDNDATEFGSRHVPLPSFFVITSPVHQPESQGTMSPIQSPIEAIERYQREQYEAQLRQLQQQKQKAAAAPAAMKQQPLSFTKKWSSYSSSGSSKPWFQKRKRKPKMSQTTLSIRSGSK